MLDKIALCCVGAEFETRKQTDKKNIFSKAATEQELLLKETTKYDMDSNEIKGGN